MSYVLDILEDSYDDVGTKQWKARLVPAIMHRVTGKITVGKRGDEHADVFRKVIPNYDHMASPEYRTGYYDSRRKSFHDGPEVDFNSTDLMTRTQRLRKYGTESLEERLDMSTPEGREALRFLYPAFRHPDTGKMYIGRRGETHNDIIDRHADEIDPIHKDKFDSNDRGFYHSRTKTFISKADSGLDSADLMGSKVNKMRRLQRDSLLLNRVSLSII
jgi:hypothetical protein